MFNHRFRLDDGSDLNFLDNRLSSRRSEVSISIGTFFNKRFQFADSRLRGFSRSLFLELEGFFLYRDPLGTGRFLC